MAAGVLQRVAARVRSNLRGRYATHVETPSHCQGAGYGNLQLVDVVATKNASDREQFANNSSQKPISHADTMILLALSLARNPRTTSVIDVEGACEARHYLAADFFGEHLKLDWMVVETREMIEAAAKVRLNEQMRVFDSFRSASVHNPSPGLILSSGALQYMSDPIATLRGILATNFRYVLIARQSLAEVAEESVAVQSTRIALNDPGSLPTGTRDSVLKYPMAHIPDLAIERELKAHGGKYVQFDDEGVLYHSGVGYLGFRSYLIQGTLI